MSNPTQRKVDAVMSIALAIIILVTLVVATRCKAHTPEIAAEGLTNMVCTDGNPAEVILLNASSYDDCDATGGGSTEAWCCCFDGVWAWCLDNAGSGGGAPTGAEYVVGASHGSLSAERVGTDTAEIDWDFGTSGQAKLNLIDGSIEVGRLKTSDTPSDGQCVVYESTGDEVAFEACGGSGSLSHPQVMTRLAVGGGY